MPSQRLAPCSWQSICHCIRRKPAIATALRKTILSLVPHSCEALKFNCLSYYHGGAPYESIGGNICMIEIRDGEVSLSFIHGAELPDPHHLLRGGGKAKRSMPIESLDAIQDSHQVCSDSRRSESKSGVVVTRAIHDPQAVCQFPSPAKRHCARAAPAAAWRASPPVPTTPNVGSRPVCNRQRCIAWASVTRPRRLPVMTPRRLLVARRQQRCFCPMFSQAVFANWRTTRRAAAGERLPQRAGWSHMRSSIWLRSRACAAGAARASRRAQMGRRAKYGRRSSHRRQRR